MATAPPGEGRGESLFHPHRSETEGSFPDLEQPLHSSSSPTGTTATPASLGRASRTSLCQHWEANTFLLEVKHSVYRPQGDLRQLSAKPHSVPPARGCRRAAGHRPAPLQEHTQCSTTREGMLSPVHSRHCLPGFGLFNCSVTRSSSQCNKALNQVAPSLAGCND